MKTKVLILSSLLAGLTFAAGCASEPGRVGVSTEIESTTVGVVTKQDSDLAASGYQLEGRIWSSPKAFSAIYRDENGSRAVVGGAKLSEGAELVALEPIQADETFWNYVERVQPKSGYRVVADGALGVSDVFFFAEKAAPQDGDIRAVKREDVVDGLPKRLDERFVDLGPARRTPNGH
jgi:hypothetical protein